MENKRKWIEFLIEKAKFNLSEEEIIKFENDLEDFETKLKALDEIDLEGVSPSVVPFVEFESELRDDNLEINKSELVLENASNTKDKYVLLKKEIK